MVANRIRHADSPPDLVRTVLSLGGVLVSVFAIFLLRERSISLFPVGPGRYYTAEFSYQLVSLAVAFLLIGLLFVIDRETLREFFGIGNLDAPVEPEPWIGLHPEKGEGWKQVGLTFATIITAVTALIAWVTQFRHVGLSPGLLGYAPWILGFSAVNAFVEETIFRLGVVVSLANVLGPDRIAVASGLLFGGVHYFGVAPRGVAGLLLAGFIGWFLAKSVLETRGMAWAWTLHFFQDIVLFTFLISGL